MQLDRGKLANFDFQLPLFGSKHYFNNHHNFHNIQQFFSSTSSSIPPSSNTGFPVVAPGGALEAFLVGSGCVRDYPIDLVTFIRSARLNPLQGAAFLGEARCLQRRSEPPGISQSAMENE